MKGSGSSISATLHVVVVGQAREPDSEIDGALMDAVETERFRFTRCQSPAEIEERLSCLVRANEAIDVLDIYDHANSGRVCLGGRNNTLFNWEGTGFDLAGRLGRFLTLDARIRLLGCDVARGWKGRRLLVDLAQRFGEQRVVWGTFIYTDHEKFRAGRFKADFEPFLFSSREAKVAEAPSAQERLIQMARCAQPAPRP